MGPRLTQDFREFLECLNAEQVEYLVVGGYAVAQHGYIRPTMDLDVWIATNPSNADRVKDAIARFGFKGYPRHPEDLLKRNQIFEMGIPPMKIEIHTDISGVEFSECYARRVMANWEGLQAPLISREDLLKNKRAAGRLKDQADIAELGD